MKENVFRTVVNSAVIGSLAACTGGITPRPTESVSPTVNPPPTEMAPTPNPTGTPEPLATPKLEIIPTPAAVSSEPYPSGDGKLILNAGGPENAEKRLGELGAGEDIAIQKELLYAQITRQGRSINDFEYKYLLNERPDNPQSSSWSMMLQEKTTGKYYWPRLTTGEDAGKMVRSGNLWQYEDRSPAIEFFTLEPIANPLGLGEVQQKLVATESGWPVVAAFGKDGQAKVWFNADQSDVVQIWEPAASFIPPTANALPVFNAQDNIWQVADTQSNILTYNPQSGEWIPFIEPTPASTEVPKMTLENWKEVFTGPHIGGDGKTYDLGIIFGEDVNTILTDPDQIKMLPLGTPIMILNPDGKIVIYADPEVAAARAKEGAIVLATKNLTPATDAMYALSAVTLQYQKGHKNFYVQFNENSSSGGISGKSGFTIELKRIFQITLDDGTIITPIMGMPKHFKVGHAGTDTPSLTLEQAGIKLDPDDPKWLDKILKAGYSMISVYARDPRE